MLQGMLFQGFVFVTHGNRFWGGHRLPNFFPEHVTFQYVESVKFVDVEQTRETHTEKELADNPITGLTADF